MENFTCTLEKVQFGKGGFFGRGCCRRVR